MGITIEEEQINQQLSKIELDQELNRKQQWRLEELEQDCRRLSMQHESFLSSILQTVVLHSSTAKNGVVVSFLKLCNTTKYIESLELCLFSLKRIGENQCF